ncbi:protein translocase subunit SecD [Tahibacter soli]|uniref:Protein translocase subunit SecD n=1 Tax=Tahibacter soli TaxID=2983605 RepID=A0A9X4BKB5_9GAMM|nr:protein translocase subunit SecD [Tahibacter soli]MDC8015553.1 protein translocase subunit SecD [Tahibacter soli]
MNEFPRWKYALVVLALLFGFLYALPNMYPKQPAVQISANRGFTVDGALKEKVQGILETQKIAFTAVELEGDRLLVRVPDLETQTKASDAVKTGIDSAGYVVALNLASTVPGWLTSIGAHGMAWGLDLQGGVHFLMEVDQKSVVDKQEQHYTDELRSLLRENKIGNSRAERGAQGVVVTLRSAEDRTKFAGIAGKAFPELIITEGATTGDAFALVAKVRPEKLKELALNTIRQNVGTLRNRINALGVAEPIIQQQGDTRIVVELPGLQDTAAAKKVLGATATLEYRAVDMTNDPATAERTGNIPPDSRLYRMREDGRPVLLKKKVIVSGDELVDASAQPDQRTGTPAVHVTLNANGGKKMLDFTMNNVGKNMAVVYIERIPEVKIVDGKEVRTATVKEEVVSNAVIQGVFSKQFQTTGLGSMKEASETALFLRAGSLAAPVDIVEERVIGPSLGQDNIAKGLLSVVIGVTLVVLFVGLYYKLFGLIADVALLLNLVLLVAILSLVQATLTLPAIAGIVLTLGMAIDANVLICERIREESRNGSTPMASIKGGYEKAWATILDANVTHLIAAFGLMAFGSGPIRGFAITLAIGIITSMFTSVTVTHVLVGLIFGGRRVKTLSV